MIPEKSFTDDNGDVIQTINDPESGYSFVMRTHPNGVTRMGIYYNGVRVDREFLVSPEGARKLCKAFIIAYGLDLK